MAKGDGDSLYPQLDNFYPQLLKGAQEGRGEFVSTILERCIQGRERVCTQNFERWLSGLGREKESYPHLWKGL